MRWWPNSVDKRLVAYLYEHFDMLDKLLPPIRSCEQHSRDNKDTLDDYTLW